MSEDGKIQNNQQAEFTSERMACVWKNISKTQLIRRPHLPAIFIIYANVTRVHSLRSDLMALNSVGQAYNSGYTLFLSYISYIQTVPPSTASGKGSLVFITLSSF